MLQLIINKNWKYKVCYHSIRHGTIVNIMDKISKKSLFRFENNLHTFQWRHNKLVRPYDSMDQSRHQVGNTNEYKKDYLMQ